MTDLSDLERCVLGASRDDFEAPQSIAVDLSTHFGRVIEEAEVMSAFVRLTQLGLVQAFQYDNLLRRFDPVKPEALSGAEDPWFLAVDTLKRLRSSARSRGAT